MTHRAVTLSLLLLVASLGAPAARAEESPALGRVSHMDGAGFASGAFGDDWIELTANAIVGEGDVVSLDPKSFVEVELEGDSWLRLAPESVTRLERLAGSDVQVFLDHGTLSLSTGATRALVTTKLATIEINDASMVRVDADADGQRVVVSVREGNAELRTDSGARRVKAGERLAWMPGMGFWREADDPTEDEFDRWCIEYEKQARSGIHDERVPEVVLGARDLTAHGSWLLVSDGWAWQPHDVVSTWRPYSNGYWSWRGRYGWTFVSYDPWGYATCHYGRWQWYPSQGWSWRPHSAWAGAWVSWGTYGSRIGWAPCDFRGRAVTCGRDRRDCGSWSSCDRDYFHGGGGHARVADALIGPVARETTIIPLENPREVIQPRAPVSTMTPTRPGTRARATATTPTAPTAPTTAMAPRPSMVPARGGRVSGSMPTSTRIATRPETPASVTRSVERDPFVSPTRPVASPATPATTLTRPVGATQQTPRVTRPTTTPATSRRSATTPGFSPATRPVVVPTKPITTPASPVVSTPAPAPALPSRVTPSPVTRQASPYPARTTTPRATGAKPADPAPAKPAAQPAQPAQSQSSSSPASDARTMDDKRPTRGR